MKFKEIINKVLELDCLNAYCLIERLGIDLIYEANMFACLCLVNAGYYDLYLISRGVPHKTAHRFQDAVYQYKKTELFGDCWRILEC